MIVVIQCAARKQPDAGYLRRRDGQRVLFVANPESAPRRHDTVYARPDDTSDLGESWRAILLRYNRNPDSNPLGLLLAYRLYQNPTYGRLVEHCGLHKTYILSAGWGLIAASFLTPQYDITFSPSADPYKRRRHSDVYSDFCMLPDKTSEDLFFFGGKDYVPLFSSLTSRYSGRRIVFYNSDCPPTASGCVLRRFVTRTRTNWHYECVMSITGAECEEREPAPLTKSSHNLESSIAAIRNSASNVLEKDRRVKLNIEGTWASLKRLQGEVFETKTGKPFTYEISGNILRPSRTQYNLSKGDFAKVLEMVPTEGPGAISNLVRGSAYIWAILHDPRVHRYP